MRERLWLAMICHSEPSEPKSGDPATITGLMQRDPSTSLGMTIAALFLLEDFHRFPRFVGRSLFVFERALEIHLGQQIVGIEFQES